MSENRNSPVPTEISTALQGIPEPVKVTALAAFSRLLGGASAYLAAWIRRPVQGVEDITNARSAVTKRLAEAAAERAVQDPELVEAALQTLLPGHLRKHANKESVVQAAAEELNRSEEPPAETSDQAKTEVDEDWLNLFERFAEDASSDRLQKLWGRVLAGEIARSGSYSKRTLRFIAELDQSTAQRCESLAPFIIGDFLPKREELKSGTLFVAALEAQQTGLLEGVGGLGLRKHLTLDSQGRTIVAGQEYGILICGSAGTKIQFGTTGVLTSTGREVFSLLKLGDEVDRLKQLVPELPKEGVSELHLVRVKRVVEGVRWWPVEELWRAPDSDQAGERNSEDD